jgi:hypothetical protein
MKKTAYLIIGLTQLLVLHFSMVNSFPSSIRPKILFIHHSVGESLIRDGNMREILSEAGIYFWDHGYNNATAGLKNEKGDSAGCYWIPDNNTRPYGYAKLFSMDLKKDNALQKILTNHDIIIFKSCFPVSKIQPDNITEDAAIPWRQSLYNYKKHYLTIKNSISKYSDKIFIIVTQPPLHPKATNHEESKRARAFTNWLQSYSFIGDSNNIFVFNYFDALADPTTNTLRSEFQMHHKNKNSHPNPLANMIMGARLSDFIINIAKHRIYSNSTNVIFNHSSWPYSLIRSENPKTNISGKIIGKLKIKRIIWSDFNELRGKINTNVHWKINNLLLNHGITKVMVTAIDENGLRYSSIVGIQYYSDPPREILIFDKTLKSGSLSNLFLSKANPINGKPCLTIIGDGLRKRVAIRDINCNISEFDPLKTFLEIKFDQGYNKTSPTIILPGLGVIILDADAKPGFETLRVPLSCFKYVTNKLNKIIIKGNWKQDTKIYIKSIRLVSSKINPSE